MDLPELRITTAKALGKDPETVPANPQWDSLDKLEIMTHLHDVLGDRAKDIEDLDNFSDLDSLAALLRDRGLID